MGLQEWVGGGAKIMDGWKAMITHVKKKNEKNVLVDESFTTDYKNEYRTKTSYHKSYQERRAENKP